MSSHRPTSVTAAITTFNQARFIEETIESVLRQTRPPDEIVVVDDGSTDSTPELLARYSSRARIIRQRNRGVAGSRNCAIVESRSDFVALLDGDDVWAPTKLQRCLELASGVDAAMIVHDIKAVSTDLQTVTAERPVANVLQRATGRAVATLFECWRELVDDNFIWTTSQVIVKRETYIEAGQCDVRLGSASDYDFYLRLAVDRPFLLIPETLCRWRQHDASASGSGHDQRLFQWALDRARVLRLRARAEGNPTPEYVRAVAKQHLAFIARQTYIREQALGSWPAAKRLFRLAKACADVRCGALGCAVLIPPRWRHAAATVTGVKVGAR